LERLRTLAAAGEIGSVADWHYSFMGATHPDEMADAAREMTRLLQGDNVDLALLIPI
jgi:D-proline reductase (dithiol) PrdB